MRRRWMASLLGAVVCRRRVRRSGRLAGSIRGSAVRAARPITDVSPGDGVPYKLADDQGRRHRPDRRDLGAGETERLGARRLFLPWDDAQDQAFHTHVATSPNLFDWTWEVERAEQASQPSIAAMSDGGYVVAWEQEPDPIHTVIASFDIVGRASAAGPIPRRFDVPVTMPACGEGTPSIERRESGARRPQPPLPRRLRTRPAGVGMRRAGPRGRRSLGRSATRR